MNDFQQIFLRWLDSEGHGIVCRPVFDEFVGQDLLFRFHGVTLRIALIVAPKKLRIDAFKGKVDPLQPWDTLFQRSACRFVPCRDDTQFEGFSCSSERHDPRCHASAESPESVVAQHCFEPMKLWIADELATSDRLLLAEGERSKWASLLKHDCEEPVPSEDLTYELVKVRNVKLRRSKLKATLRSSGR